MPAKTHPEGTEVEALSGQVVRWDPETPLDRRVAEVLMAQEGVISIEQLARCGLSGRAARGRVRSGRLVRIHRGVYALSERLPPLGPVVAAILACRRPAFASHSTAARIHDLRADGRSLVHVCAGTSTGRLHRDVQVHFGARLDPQDTTMVKAIPTTSVARTILDCAPQLGRRGTEKLVRESEFLGVIDLGAIRDLQRRLPGHCGWATVRAALGDAADHAGRTASRPEDALLASFRELGLTGFECNAPIALDDGAYAYPDFLFRTARLAVEADPRSTHDRTSSYRSDRRRDRVLKRLHDIDTMRFSDSDLTDPRACAREIAERTGQRRALRTSAVRK